MSPTSLSQESSLDLIDDDAATSLLCLEEDSRSSCDGEPNKQGEKRKIEDSSSSPPPKPSTKRPREKKLKCHYPDCSATFSRPDRLQTHIDGNHVHILRFQCPTCGESFASQGYLSKHIGRVHNKQTRKKTTPKSNSISEEEDSELEASSSSFSSALPTDELGVIRRGSACPSCARVFRRKYQLRLHRAELHGEPLPHRCPHCPASFPLLYKLRRHCGSVHQPRLYRCAFTTSANCPFTTDKFSLLRKHHATGHPEIRLRCAACGKTYRRADSLRIHEETAHSTLDGSGRVPVFACDRPGCSKTYSRESCLRTHLRNSHDAPRFGPCEKCGGRFRHSKSFRQHVAKCKKKGMMPGEEENAQSKEPSQKVKKVKVKERTGAKEAKKVEKKQKKKPVDEEQRKAVAAYRRRLQRLPPVVFEEEEENENGDGEGGDVEVTTDEVDLVVKVVVDHQTLPADDEGDGGGGGGGNDLTAA